MKKSTLKGYGRIEFQDIVEKNSEGFSDDQFVFFAWLCAVRTLPFYGSDDYFWFWRGKERSRHLLSVFTAIDVAYAYYAYVYDESSYIDDVYADAADSAAYYASAMAEDAYYDADFASDECDDEAAFLVSAAASNAVQIAVDIGKLKDHYQYIVRSYIREAADCLSTAAYYSMASSVDSHFEYDATELVSGEIDSEYSAKDAERCNVKFQHIILDDIEKIKKGKFERLLNDTGVYGDTWQLFLDSLNETGCKYWAKLYEGLFRDKFVVDKDKLRRRLNIPDELKKQGAVDVGLYLEELGAVERLNEARIIILGEKGAGKTSLARKLIDINKTMPKENESTEGVTVLPWKLPGGQPDEDMYVHVWDFAGHTITHAAHRCFMSTRALYIYVYNGRIEHDNRPDYWLEQIRMYGGSSPILFLINEKDGHKPVIERKTLKNEYPSIIRYFDVDIGSKNTDKLKEFRQTVIKTLQDNPAWNRQEIRADAYRIKEELRSLFLNNSKDFITHEVFTEIADKKGASPKDFEKILGLLKILGVCLWYNEPEMRDFNNLVLNPDWITHGIYRIINWGHKFEKHILSIDDGVKIFSSKYDKNRYPRDKIRFLFKLMRQFELAFFEDKEENRVFVPLLLPTDRPDVLPTFSMSDRLTMVYEVRKTMPPNISSRIIVRRHEEIKNEKELWRKGAVLHYSSNKATALIVESDRTLTVRIKGESKTAYLASLRETLNDVFGSYEKLKPKLLYELIGNHDGVLFESSDRIVEHLEKGIDLLISDKYIPLESTESAYALEDSNRKMRAEIRELKKLISELNKQILELPAEKRQEASEALQAIEMGRRTSKPNKTMLESMFSLLNHALAKEAAKEIVSRIREIIYLLM